MKDTKIAPEKIPGKIPSNLLSPLKNVTCGEKKFRINIPIAISAIKAAMKNPIASAKPWGMENLAVNNPAKNP